MARMSILNRELWVRYPANSEEQRIFLKGLAHAGFSRTTRCRLERDTGEYAEADVRFSVIVEPPFSGEAFVGIRMEILSRHEFGITEPWTYLETHLQALAEEVRKSAPPVS